MTERKVLNKYFPPDFDPSKIPRLKRSKKDKVFSIRTMAPFNMMCLKCKEYIFKAKKFNSRMEESGDTYLELKEYKFYIRCPTCCNEIIYKTDRENNDYALISGAKRSFEAGTAALRQAKKDEAAEKEELEKNPIKALEKRTEESMNEFRMNNKLQDLLEKYKRSRSREEIIDDTLEMIKKEQKDKDIKERLEDQQLVDQMMEERLKLIAQQKIEAEAREENRLQSITKNCGNVELKKALLEKRKQAELNTTEAKSMKFDQPCSSSTKFDDSDQLSSSDNQNKINETNLTENDGNCLNALGIDYDSD